METDSPMSSVSGETVLNSVPTTLHECLEKCVVHIVCMGIQRWVLHILSVLDKNRLTSVAYIGNRSVVQLFGCLAIAQQLVRITYSRSLQH